MIEIRDLAWLAGLIEGEGSFMSSKSGSRGNSRTPTIAIQMTDGDVINRAATVMGVKPWKPWQCKKGNRKLVHHFSVHGARAIGWMMTLYTFMGERRQAKIREVIDIWKHTSKCAPRGPRRQPFMAMCHPDRPRAGHGLCDQCYMREWRKRTGRNGNFYRKRAALAAQGA